MNVLSRPLALFYLALACLFLLASFQWQYIQSSVKCAEFKNTGCLQQTSRTLSRHVGRASFVPPDDLYFVVSTPSYSDFCGGCVVLHRLCDRLNTIYDDVRATPICYLVSLNPLNASAVNPGYKTPMLPQWMNASSGIVIYPEIVAGNPLKADRVVNWILYFPGVNGGPRASEYDKKNLIACFSPGYCADFNGSTYHLVALRVFDYQFMHFLNVVRPTNRSGYVTFRHKEKFETLKLGIIDTSGQFPVPENPLKDGGKRSRIEQYAQAERFYSMDPATFRSVEAAMAGTLSVVVPVPGVSKVEWLESAGDEFQYGVAYGDEDISHAQSTLPLVIPYMRSKASYERSNLDTFVQEAVSFFARK